MSTWSGGTEKRVKSKPVFSSHKGGGPLARTLAWIVVAILVLSQCSARHVPPEATNCALLPESQRYLMALYEPDETGNPGMDWMNDYLAFVPPACYTTMRIMGYETARMFDLQT